MWKFTLLSFVLSLADGEMRRFSEPLQRVLYDGNGKTLVVASVNRLYSLNPMNLTVLHQHDIRPPTTMDDQSCRNSTIVPFLQLFLLVNRSILLCSTLNRGGSCQLRSLIDLQLEKTSAERLVASSPLYPSVGFLGETNGNLYIGTTFDRLCDRFYEIPTIAGRYLVSEPFLSPNKFHSAQSALQQTTNTLRLLNLRLIKEYFLRFVYAFEWQEFAYFISIQQIHLQEKHRFQTKIGRFCQNLPRPMLKSYVEIPLSCADGYFYLVRAKYSLRRQILYGLFRNTTSPNDHRSSQAICQFSIDEIQRAFSQTIERCLVDGYGSRGLAHLNPETPCVAQKSIQFDSCSNDDESFLQYPIGSDRPLVQRRSLVQLHEKINFTGMEIADRHRTTFVVLSDDRGNVRQFDASKSGEVYRRTITTEPIIDLQIVDDGQSVDLVVLTPHQLIKEEMFPCETTRSCFQCSTIPFCRWSLSNSSCETADEDRRTSTNDSYRCFAIERVRTSKFQMEILLNSPLEQPLVNYRCEFEDVNGTDRFVSDVTSIRNDTITCSFPQVEAIEEFRLSIFDREKNENFARTEFTSVNCSSIRSCSFCSTFADRCFWNVIARRCDVRLEENSSTEENTCSKFFLPRPTEYFTPTTNSSLTFLVEQCNEDLPIKFCHLTNHRKRFISIGTKIVVRRSNDADRLCQVECFFSKFSDPLGTSVGFQRPFAVELSTEYFNRTRTIVNSGEILLYHCNRLASNCSSCVELERKFRCVWCEGMCLEESQTRQCRSAARTIDQCPTPTIFPPAEIPLRTPKIHRIDPLIGIESGGTSITIDGEDLSNGDGHVSIFIGSSSCPIQFLSPTRIECETNSFAPTKFSRDEPIRFIFDRQTEVNFSSTFLVVADPLLYSFDPFFQYRSFKSGGHRLTILGENFQYVQNMQLELNKFLVIAPHFHNSTHLIFLTPPFADLQSSGADEVSMTLFLDNFNRTSSLMYFDDPLVRPLQPFRQKPSNILVFHGENLTSIGSTLSDVRVLIGCDECPLIEFRSDRIVCRPTKFRRCPNSEELRIVVLIDSLRIHVGFLVAPRRSNFVWLTVVSFVSVLFSIVFIVFLRRKRFVKKKFVSPTMRIRPFVNYLQMFFGLFGHWASNDDRTQHFTVDEEQRLAQFERLIVENERFRDELFLHLIKTKNQNERLFRNFLLCQRYNLKIFTKIPDELLLLNIFILVSYRFLSLPNVRSLISRIYFLLKRQIFRGPINGRFSYFSLNPQTLLNERFFPWKSVRLVVQLRQKPKNNLIDLCRIDGFSCETIDEIKEKVLFQRKIFSQFSADECQVKFFHGADRWKTLDELGVLTDDFQLELILPEEKNFVEENLFAYLPSPPPSPGPHSHLLVDEPSNQTERVSQTKKIIDDGFRQLIDVLFVDLRHSETFLSELIEETPQVFHQFYAHFIPLLIEELHCFLDVPNSNSLRSSLEMLALVFAIGCADEDCSSCAEFRRTHDPSLIETCSSFFADEIQRVRFHRFARQNDFSTDYSTANNGIETTLELDRSIICSLFEYASKHFDLRVL